MFKIFCACVVYLAAAVAHAQEAVNDPTKPIGFSGTGQASGKVQDTIQLTSILIASDRKVAIINGQPLRESQTLTGVGVVLKKIDADAVTLQQNGKIWRVPLNNTAIRK